SISVTSSPAAVRSAPTDAPFAPAPSTAIFGSPTSPPRSRTHGRWFQRHSTTGGYVAAVWVLCIASLNTPWDDSRRHSGKEDRGAGNRSQRRRDWGRPGEGGAGRPLHRAVAGPRGGDAGRRHPGGDARRDGRDSRPGHSPV